MENKNNIEKENEYLRILAQNQQKALDIYKRRFNKVKRSVTNPFYGIAFLFSYMKRKMWRFFPSSSDREYTKWIKSIESQEKYDTHPLGPSITLIVYPLSGISMPSKETIDSINKQIRLSDEVLIVEDYPSLSEAIKNSQGDYIAFLGNQDILSENAIIELTLALEANPDTLIVYSDEDTINIKTGLRSNPFFKPDFSPDTLISFFYISSFTAFNKQAVLNTEIFEREHISNYSVILYEIALKIADYHSKVIHIPKILYHSTEKRLFNSGNKDELISLKNDYLTSNGYQGKIDWVETVNAARITFTPQDSPLVSIIIPSKDNYEVLSKCISSLVNLTSYKNYEIIIIDNGSADDCRQRIISLCADYCAKYFYSPMDFNFSKMCNIGVSKASGEYLLFLNDDIEIIGSDWLSIMLGCAMLSHVGAVGAKLLYPGEKIIQHDGVMNVLNGPVHALHYGKDSNIYYHGRNRLDFDVCAVTGAALLISNDKFHQVGGFDEELSIGFNDIDLCYKLIEQGYYNVIRNDAILIHHESISRGYDAKSDQKTERLLAEQRYLYINHPQFMSRDPFYNINLTQTNVDYSLDINPF